MVTMINAAVESLLTLFRPHPAPLNTPTLHRRSYQSFDATPATSPVGIDQKVSAAARQSFQETNSQENSPGSDSETSSLDSTKEKRKLLVEASPQTKSPAPQRKTNQKLSAAATPTLPAKKPAVAKQTSHTDPVSTTPAKKGILRTTSVPIPPTPTPSNCEKYCACLPRWALRMAGVTAVALLVLSTMYQTR